MSAAWLQATPGLESPPPLPRPRWIEGTPTPHQVTEDVSRPLSGRPGPGWYTCFAASLLALAVGVACIAYLLAFGVGVWGLDRSVGWAFDITNFVFWIGIGHAGTLISAILLLLRQRWRTSISRAAEAMTVFALVCAGLFPLIHMGRPWLAFWILPYPNDRGPLWVNFRSPLVWDVFAINTYLLVSLLFWYLGMIPDFASLRDRAAGGLRRAAYRLLSLGWNGSARVWWRYETASLILAGLATPLVISVHSIVSMDFATSVLPGWHVTLFPPYFVAGAVFSGFGMVLTLLILSRKVMGLERYITLDHLEAMAKVTLFTGCLVGFAYASEVFFAWYGGNPHERFVVANRAAGPYAWAFWTMVACNALVPQLLWLRRVRRSPGRLLAVSVLVNLGMWLERFVIIVATLHRGFLPSSWTVYRPTLVEVGTLVGSFGLFFSLFLLFVRFLPMLAMWEVKGHVAAVSAEEGAGA